ncbi:hypothetical protein SanaruYs_25760 [Chryseotalea sanaruensis]|uniref:DUF5689 domain-containing protein n=1 Tax=Chryseotalea sanaruensis TaxID=2482724 RepID=A0A401UBU0_9BACT|nr:carboxypeptidase regulatory-like domain-containing protein [Chryseotalea sanaruensis]GCC52340.1 hypothetical protein SanaruYs_25760 [Chryseotalea sanaruensis]
MILRKLKLFGMIAIVASATFFGCKDDFTEGDFLKLQNELAKEKEKRDSAYLEAMTQEQAESYIAALNEAGDLLSITVLVREDNTPVAGVSVSIASGSTETTNGRTKEEVTVVTDAAGRAVFERVTIGDNVISLSKANYVSASARVDFGTPPVPIALNTNINGTSVTRYIAPPKRFENFALPLYSESDAEGNTAVIQGTFRIENDLTNDPNVMDAIPAELVVAANLSTALANAGSITSSCNCVADYRFTGGEGSLGVATIDAATGAFSMRVPATANGLNISMIYPTIVGTQRIAVRRLNGVDITPEFRQVPVRWDPATAASTNIPVIPGARAVFTYNGSSTPAPAGRGFTITNFTPVARPLSTGTVSNTGNTTLSNTTYRINSRGLDYTSAPTVTISGGGGSGATAESFLRLLTNSFNITNGGSGYAGGLHVIEFTYIDQNAAVQVYATSGQFLAIGGALPTGLRPLPNVAGFAPNAPYTTPNQIQGFGYRVVDVATGQPAAPTTPATFVVDDYSELGGIQITNGGSGYTTAPTIALAAGGTPVNTASVTVPAFRTQFNFSLPTGVATTPYRVLPNDIQFIYPANAVDGQTIEISGKVDLINPIGTTQTSNADFIVNLTTDGTNIIALNEGLSFRTNRFWTTAPTVFVQDRTIEAAAANLTIDAVTGQVTFQNPFADGGLSNQRLIPDAANTITGQGYDAVSVEIVPTITGAPGSGAVFNLTTTQNVDNRLVTWGGATVRLSPGAGYLANLNRTNAARGYSGTTTNIVVQTGKVYNLTIDAGTGVRLEAIEN